MEHSLPDYRLLIEYERSRREGRTNIKKFAHENKIAAELQLELIALDIEIRLKIGDVVRVEDYHLDFPHLVQKLPPLLRDTRKVFLANYCPVSDRIGKLPTEFGGYRIESEIGRGGMGVVYQAIHLGTQQPCAMKVLFINRGLEREAEALRRIRHPNVCQIIEVGKCENTPFLCTRKVHGQNLKEKLREEGFLSPVQAATIVAKLASGFEAVHANDVVHFDIKTSNILIDSRNEPIALDFGLAKIEDGRVDCEEVFGSPGYFAPEMLDRKFGSPGKSCDVYGLSVVLYELLTGVKPFRGSASELFDQICNYPPSRPTDFSDRHIDTTLEEICLRGMKKKVSERTPSMSALRESLMVWLASSLNRAA